MKVHFEPGIACGEATPPYSKSEAHRLLIAASCAFCDGICEESVLHGIPEGDDVNATLQCLTALGAVIKREGEAVRVQGVDLSNSAPVHALECAESASTIRFLIPLALLLPAGASFVCGTTLVKRPLDAYEKLFSEKSFILQRDGPKITVNRNGRKPAGGEYHIDGAQSSQFTSGLLFLLPQLAESSVLTVTGSRVSEPYAALTLSVLRRFGVNITKDGNSYFIPGQQRFRPACLTAERDMSAAAALAAFGLFGGSVELSGLPEHTLQADAVYPELFRALLYGTPEIDLSDCPDLAPVLFSVAAYHNGAGFRGIRCLGIKESNRTQVMAKELSSFGVKIVIHNDDYATVEKCGLHKPAAGLSSHGDHRVAMALSLLLSRFGGTLLGAESVSKSFPGYFDTLHSLGIRLRIDNG